MSITLNYKKYWNASSNTPTLINGTGTLGDVYVIKVGGSQNLGGGTITYNPGQYIYYDGASWQQVATFNALTAIGDFPAQSSGGGGGGGMTNPMTTLGDMIYGFTAGAPVRLPIGTSNQILTVIAGIPTWTTPVYGTVTSITAGTGLSGGIITSSGTISMPNVGTAGTYTYATITTDAQGRITSASSGSAVGLITLNGDSTGAQTLTVGTTGADFTIVDNGSGDHKFNFPNSSNVNRGLLIAADWITFNNKQNALIGSGIVKSNGGAITYISGTTSQFVKGDGSLDSNTYLTTISGIGAGGDLTGTYPNPTIGLNKTTYAKIQQASSHVLLGNSAGTTSNVSEIAIGSGLVLSGSTLQANSSSNTYAAGSGINLSGSTFSLISPVTPQLGGTGIINNSASTLTLSPFSYNIATSGVTSVTTPVSGVYSTLANTETLSNKTLFDSKVSISSPATNATGYLGIPQNSQSAGYTTVMADAGKHLYHPGADTTARTWTIDSNTNVAYPIGTTLTFVNDTSAGVITIAITSDTLVLAGAGTTGSRTLAANGMATAIKMTSVRWMINGSGLT